MLEQPYPLVRPTAPPPPRPRVTWPGILAFALGLATAAALGSGIALAASDRFVLATTVAWVGIGASVVAVIIGILALVGRFGTSWAVAGIVFAVIANPLVLTTALDVIGGRWA